GSFSFDGSGRKAPDSELLRGQAELLSEHPVPPRLHDALARDNGVYAIFSDQSGSTGTARMSAAHTSSPRTEPCSRVANPERDGLGSAPSSIQPSCNAFGRPRRSPCASGDRIPTASSPRLPRESRRPAASRTNVNGSHTERPANNRSSATAALGEVRQ